MNSRPRENSVLITAVQQLKPCPYLAAAQLFVMTGQPAVAQRMVKACSAMQLHLILTLLDYRTWTRYLLNTWAIQDTQTAVSSAPEVIRGPKTSFQGN